jgi:hypothetical protein
VFELEVTHDLVEADLQSATPVWQLSVENNPEGKLMRIHNWSESVKTGTVCNFSDGNG